ncbi:reverse transcriptase domain-containing protein [Wolbachia endosymbiont of Psylliodes chrysocephala]|uniref:reverse transcriptase domain-containing protein n=1 Tax=Wolbachia endosymbiont of Psylliodes chrysocephala TaxID=2883236 RepID=UPI00211187EE|nr:reverse transcriptase domain-containing protein [Wolbachia endosymbiont of Psylliodes chrysocephala]
MFYKIGNINLIKKYLTLAVFIDLQRALETVDQNCSIKKLKSMGIVEQALEWCLDFLSKRKQKLKVNNSLSEEINYIRSVPQGSILGLLLFLVYINDIVDFKCQCDIHLFADDALIYFSCKDSDNLVKVVNETLQHVYKWCCNNLLKINTIKQNLC